MQCLDLFLDDCRIRGLSPKTTILYKCKITDFLTVTPKIEDWPHCFTWLAARYENPRTRHQAYRIIRTYIRWQAAHDMIARDWASGQRLKCPQAAPTPVLDIDDFKRLLAAIPIGNPAGRRDRAFFSALFYTGARRDAFRLLPWERLDLPRRVASVVTKGGKEQLINLPRVAALELNSWRCFCPSGRWVFPSIWHPEKPVEGRHISKRITDYAKKAGMGRVYLHLLRHSFGTLMVRKTNDIYLVKEAMGHSQISTTIGYLRRARQEAVREAIDKVFE
ncbi:MAG: site-specific integrase [Bryobacteraceae bacterium]